MCDICRTIEINARLMDKIGKAKGSDEIFEFNGSYDYGRRSTGVYSEPNQF